jgi:hypothetical protein
MIITHNGTILTNDGVVLNNITTSPSFQNTYSLDFDGVDDYVSFSNEWFAPTTPLNATDGNHVGSVSMWFNLANVTQYDFMMFLGTSFGGPYHYIAFDTQGNFSAGRNLRVGLIGSDNAGGEVGGQVLLYDDINATYGGTGITWQPNTWYHIAVVYDKNATNRMIIYIDGVAFPVPNTVGVTPNGARLTGTMPYSLPYTTGGSIAGNKCQIGGYYNTISCWAGKADEVSLYDKVLTPTEIATLSTAPTVDLSSLNPIAWYRNGDNGSYKSPQWLIPNNENKDKVSNYSMEFDGVNDYIDLGSSSTVADGGQFSLSFWIKGNTQPIGAKYLFSADYYNLHTFWTIQNTELYWRNVNNNYKLLSTNLLDGEWHHILIIWNPDGANSTIRCFTDGVNEVNIATDFRYAPGWNGGAYQGGLQYIGNRGGGTFPGFNGSIDEFAVWDNDQSSNILSIYNGGTPTTISGAVAHYKMGEDATFNGGNWTLPDSVGTNDGTSANMTIEDRIGEAPGSVNNALSFNMDLIDRVEDTPATP